MADRIIVMSAGRIEQEARPRTSTSGPDAVRRELHRLAADQPVRRPARATARINVHDGEPCADDSRAGDVVLGSAPGKRARRRRRPARTNHRRRADGPRSALFRRVRAWRRALSRSRARTRAIARATTSRSRSPPPTLLLFDKQSGRRLDVAIRRVTVAPAPTTGGAHEARHLQHPVRSRQRRPLRPRAHRRGSAGCRRHRAAGSRPALAALGLRRLAGRARRALPDHHWVYGANLDMDASYRDAAGRLVNRRRQFGTMILSRLPIVSSRNHLLPKYGTLTQHSIQQGALEAVIVGRGARGRYESTRRTSVTWTRRRGCRRSTRCSRSIRVRQARVAHGAAAIPSPTRAGPKAACRRCRPTRS